MLILKNADIYSPKHIGIKHILIGEEKILKIFDEIPESLGDVETIDLDGKKIVPGLIDQHLHITGGGGEGGYKTKVPELPLSLLIKAGITTAVGLLGTDSVTRSVENLASKALALTEEGITTYFLTGSYEYPSPTITGSAKKDIVFIENCIGIKIAANDHRDSAIMADELARLGSEARVAGMISGKSGHVTVHLGSGKFNLDQIYKAIDISNLPITTFRPTHVNRSEDVFKASIEFAKKGGYIDITSRLGSGRSDVELYEIVKKEGILDKVTFSSDGFGSWSNYDDEGNLLEIGYSPLDTSIRSLKEIVDNGENLEDAILPYTLNVASLLRLDKEVGRLKEGYFANILVLDNNLELDSVISRGKVMMKDKELLVKGTYEL